MELKRSGWVLLVPIIVGALVGRFGSVGLIAVIWLAYVAWCLQSPLVGLAWAFAVLPLDIPQIEVAGLHLRPFEFLIWPATLSALFSPTSGLRGLSPAQLRPLWPTMLAVAYLSLLAVLLWGLTSALELRMWLSCALLMIVVFGAARNSEFRQHLVRALSWSAVLIAAIAVSQRLLGGPLFSGLEEPRDLIRVLLLGDISPVRIANATFPHSNAAGAYLTILVSVLLSLTLAGKAHRLVHVGLIAALLALYLTYSRGATLAAGAAASVVLWSTLRERAKKLIVGVVAGAVIVAAAAIVPILLTSPYVLTISLGLRTLLWRAYLNAWLESPLIGLGPGNAFQEAQFLSPYGSQYAAHSNYLYILADYGMIGLFLLAYAFIRHARNGARAASTASLTERPWLIGCSALLVALALHGIVDHTLTDLSYRALVFAMVGLSARFVIPAELGVEPDSAHQIDARRQNTQPY